MPVLFISRGTMSGVEELVKKFHSNTNVRCISREDLLSVVAKHGDLALKVATELPTATSAYGYFSQLRRPYTILMRQALLEAVLNDNILYHGFSGQLLLPRIKHFIRIRIDAPLELRIPPTMKKLGSNKEDACKYINEMDEQRVRWARYTYGRDIRDPSLYDIQFNLGHISLGALCGILENLMAEPDLQATEDSQIQAKKLLQSTNIETALICDSRTRNFEIHVRYEENRIHMVGPYLEEKDLNLVKQVIRDTGQKEEIEYVPGYAPTLDIDGWQQFAMPGK